MTDTGRPLADRDYRSLAEFRRALRQFLSFSEAAARAADLTPVQHQLLLAIRGFVGPGAPSLSDMADNLQLRLHSTGELVRRAEAKGLVVRSPDPVDARRVLLALSPEGEDRLAGLTRTHRDELRRFRSEASAILDELG